jgi:molecular chaperone HtpG
MTAVTKKFRAEMKQLMDIIIHSLYSNKEIFLRELISNAVDAIDKARFLGLTQPAILEDNADWKIVLRVDKPNSALTVSDNGIGMSPESIVEELGVIAKSGAKEFLDNLKTADVQNQPELIGQFGVGFYSAFMVADKVTVESRQAGDPENGVRWTSAGEGTYTVEKTRKEKRGTDVTLHLKDDAKEYLEDWQLRAIVKKFSDFVEHPIVIDVEKEVDGKKQTVEETLNLQKAIWVRAKGEIKDEEYTDFYKHLTRDTQAPLKTIHYAAEGQMEFRALLFVPARRPPAFMAGDPFRQGPSLYVKRVFITENAEALLPPYLRFVRGLVDSSDLPLNVSREMLQDNPLIGKIQKALTNKILQTLIDMAQEEPDKYADFFREWGLILKAGAYTDFENRERLAELLRYESTKTAPGKYTSLAAYVAGMKPEQKDIYYLIGVSRDLLERSPYLENLRAREWETLLMTDPIDEWVVGSLHEYKEKHFKAADKSEAPGATDAERQTVEGQFQPLLAFFKEKLPEIKDARLSSRLKESAAVLVVEEGEMSSYLESVLKQLGQEKMAKAQRILELNPDHAAVQAMRGLFEQNAADPRLADYVRLLYDQAVLAEGSRPADPAAFARRINDLIAKDAQAAKPADAAAK